MLLLPPIKLVTQLTAPVAVLVTPARGELEDPPDVTDPSGEVSPPTAPPTAPTAPERVLPTTGSDEATWLTVPRTLPTTLGRAETGVDGAALFAEACAELAWPPEPEPELVPGLPPERSTIPEGLGADGPD